MTNIEYAINMGWIKPSPPQEDACVVAHREYTRQRMAKWRQDHPKEYAEQKKREVERRKVQRRTGVRP